MSSFSRKAGLLAAAAMAASVVATPLSAHERSFSALQAIDAQPLSAVEMDAVHGQAYTLAVTALLAYASSVQSTQTASSYTTLAVSLSQVRTTTFVYYSRTSTSLTLVRR